MTSDNKNIWVAMIVIAIIAIGAYFYPSVTHVVTKEVSQASQSLGSTGCGTITCLSGGLRLVTGAGGDFESDVAAVFTSTVTIGGNAITAIKSGICAGSFVDTTIVATSTTLATCTDATVQAGDTVVVTMGGPTLSTGINAGNFVAENAIATTSGQFGVTVRNVTGAATSSIATTYKKINYVIFR